MKAYDAKICVECDELVPIQGRACPSCTCHTFLLMSAVYKPAERPQIDAARKAMAELLTRAFAQ